MGIWGNDQPRGNDINVPSHEDPQDNTPKARHVPRVTGRHDDIPREGV